MAKATILLVDNDPYFVSTRKADLEQEGYAVVTAEEATQGRRILHEGGIDLAILDVRLIEDNDPSDLSGLILAKESSHSLPKIIILDYENWKQVRMH